MEVVRKIEASNELREIEDNTARKNSSNALASANSANNNSVTAVNVANSAKDTANAALTNVNSLNAVISTIQADIAKMKTELQETYGIANGALEEANRKTFKARAIQILDSAFVNGRYTLTEADKENLFGEIYSGFQPGGLVMLFTTVDDLTTPVRENYVQLVEYYNNRFKTDPFDTGYSNFNFAGKNISILKNPNFETNYKLYAIQANEDSGWV